MARIEQLKPPINNRQNRFFSEEFKKKKIGELEKGLVSMAEICKEYSVSRAAVYKWIYKFSIMRKKSEKMVVETESDTAKIKLLKEYAAELEKLLGQKQFEIDFLNKQLEIASEQYGIDVKKKLSGKPSPGSGETENPTSTP